MCETVEHGLEAVAVAEHDEPHAFMAAICQRVAESDKCKNPSHVGAEIKQCSNHPVLRNEILPSVPSPLDEEVQIPKSNSPQIAAEALDPQPD